MTCADCYTSCIVIRYSYAGVVCVQMLAFSRKIILNDIQQWESK